MLKEAYSDMAEITKNQDNDEIGKLDASFHRNSLYFSSENSKRY